jgi:hypothetical protein
MTKRDNEKDSERPHYYSQFWLDVAAGRRIIGTPKPNEEGEQTEAELLDTGSNLKTAYAASNGQQSNAPSRATINGRANGIASSEEELDTSSDEEYTEPEEDLDLTLADMEDQGLPVEDTDIPDMDFSALDEDEEYLDEEEQNDPDALEDAEDFEEEEEEENWGRGRKKPKSSRPTKAPAKKPAKRDTRRGGY